MNKFYVYCYYDPRVYPPKPFYIGKGYKDRMFAHLTEAKKNKSANILKIRKIQSIWKDNFEPIIEIIDNNLSEMDALEFEEFLISEIGRIKDDGILTNILTGGHIMSGKNNPMYGVNSVTVKDLRDNNYKRVSKEDFEKYDHYVGVSKGMDYYQEEKFSKEIIERNSDRIHIYNTLNIKRINVRNRKSKMVKSKDLIWYLADGWKIGRLPFKTFVCEYCGVEMTVNNKTQHTRKCQREHSL